MPVASEQFKRSVLLPDHELVREVRCVEGEVEVEVNVCPRPRYGRESVPIRDNRALGLRMEVGSGAYWLRGSVPLVVQKSRARTTLNLKRGDVAQFVLTFTERAPSVLPALGHSLTERIDRSVRWWQDWANHCSYDGPYREAVVRSALALKLLSYAPSGAIAAAATTSLPEILGGSLNWDYRYCWLRDASLTIRAMLGLGYTAEAEHFLTWLLYATALTQPELRVLYSLYGEIAPHEHEINYLRGYRDSRPVRVGNGARSQLQLDVYGELIDAAAQYTRQGGSFDRSTQKILAGFGEYVAKHWDSPDEGLWEPRSGRKDHTNSRLMCWTALDRLLEMHTKQRIQALPKDLFESQRNRIREQIEQRAWNSEMQSYTSILEGSGVDASLLRIPWYGFEKANSARMHSTYNHVRQQLGAGDNLLYRYKRNPPEGAFGICGFWLAEYLAIGGGSLEQAHDCFRDQLAYQNSLGLFAEEIDPATGDARGNFPQAFTHIGLISAALSLLERERGEAHPAEKRHEPAPAFVRRSKQKMGV